MASHHHNPLSWIEGELTRLDEKGLRRRLTVRDSSQQPTVEVSGNRAGQQVVDFRSNDYLGLANNERLLAAAREAVAEFGWGSGASPLISGRTALHAKLEIALAQFEGTEAALVFPSGFAANCGTIPALVGPRDVVFGDSQNHASIIDGCRLSGARRIVYRHCDPNDLEAKLRKATSHRRRLIVTDSLFSMDGDLAPLVELADLALRYDAMLMVDEAHATGVFGSGGRGVVEHMVEQHCAEQTSLPELHHCVHVRVGTLSKALGSGGGFVCGSQALVDWLANRARAYVFSTAQPAANCAAALAALDVVQQEPERGQQLLATAEKLRLQLAEAGWQTGRSASQIVPILVGEPEAAVALSAALRKDGFLVPAIRPPSVPKGGSLLRLSLCANHTPEMLARLVAALGRL